MTGQGGDAGLLGELFATGAGRRGAGCRGRRAARACGRAGSGGGQACRRSWSCRSLAGRPSETGSGAGASRLRGTAPAPPRASISTSLTILMTSWPGLTLSRTSAPRARSRTAVTKVLTTGRATSASSRARRTSRRASAMSASFSAPRARRRSKTPDSLPDSVSNIGSPQTVSAPLREPSRSGVMDQGRGMARQERLDVKEIA